VVDYLGGQAYIGFDDVIGKKDGDRNRPSRLIPGLEAYPSDVNSGGEYRVHLYAGDNGDEASVRFDTISKQLRACRDNGFTVQASDWTTTTYGDYSFKSREVNLVDGKVAPFGLVHLEQEAKKSGDTPHTVRLLIYVRSQELK